jgi:putative MATE family efflux protein
MRREKILLKNNLPGFYKTVFHLALPIILQNLMQTFVNMLDTIMVGRLGTKEIAAVGLGNQIFFILNMILFGVSSGGSVFVSQMYGRGDTKGIQKTVGLMTMLSVFASLIFMSAAFFAPDFLMSLYSKDSAVVSLGARYLRVVAVSYFFIALGFPFQISFRSIDHVFLPMVCTGISILLNLVCNYVFIFGVEIFIFGARIFIPSMGVAGAALGTVVARFAETFILLAYSILKKFEIFSSPKNFFQSDRNFAAKFFSVAFPVVINESLWGLGVTLQNSIFSHAGTFAIASYNITGTISQLTWVFFIGVGNASGIILGKKIGEGKTDEVKAYAFRFLWFIPLCAVFLGMLLCPLSALLPFLFNVEKSVLFQARCMLLELMAAYPFNAFCMYFIVGFCRAGGDTKYAAFHDIFWMWCVSLPLASFGAFYLKLEPRFFYLFLFSESFIKSIAGILRFRSGKWLRDLSE